MAKKKKRKRHKEPASSVPPRKAPTASSFPPTSSSPAGPLTYRFPTSTAEGPPPGGQGGGAFHSSFSSLPGDDVLTRGQPLAGIKPKKKPKDQTAVPTPGGGPPRDLSSIVSYGPSYLPFTQAWTEWRQEQVKAFKHWVYVGIRYVCLHVAPHSPNVTWVHGDNDPARGEGGKSFSPSSSPYRCHRPGRRLTLAARRRALTPLLSHEHLEPVPSEHPLLQLLRSPNDFDDGYDLWYETLLYLLLTGNAYWWLPPSKAGLPLAVWVLPSHWVWPVRGRDRLIDAYEIRPTEGAYLRQVFSADDVIVFQHKNPLSKIDGYSPLAAMSDWCDTQDMIARAQRSSYENGATPTIAVEFDGKLHDPSNEDLRRIDAKWAARFAGPTRANRPIFMPPGVKLRPLSLKPNEMLFGETQDRMRDNILAALGVPVSCVMGGNTSTSANLAAQESFYTGCVNPLLRYMGQRVTAALAKRYDDTLRVWWEDRNPEAPEVLERQLLTDLQAGCIAPNEIRALRGREPIPEDWADRPLMPVNMQQVPPGGPPFGGQHQDPATQLPNVQGGETSPDRPL